MGSLNTLTINLCLLGHGSALETAAQTLSCVFSRAERMKHPQKEGRISAYSLNTRPQQITSFYSLSKELRQSPGLGCTPLCLFSSQSPALAHLFAFLLVLCGPSLFLGLPHSRMMCTTPSSSWCFYPLLRQGVCEQGLHMWVTSLFVMFKC